MKLYSVHRLDRTDGRAPDLRAQLRPAHRDYMKSFGARVRLGGPLLDENGQGIGGLMVIEAENLEDVRDIVANDPFEKAGLSERIDILELRWQSNRPADLPPL